ncbi:VOC family protein [Micrococcales bacterium 31B]|nr:VOC family protein [Micrococcales bacterium 31B]
MAARVLGQPIWIDLMTRDYEVAFDFYTHVFGWTVQRGGEEFGGYSQFFQGDDPIAGCMVAPEQDAPPSMWSTYLAAPDIEDTLNRAQAAGATLMFGPHKVADFGSMAGLQDPAGAFVCLWQANTHAGYTYKAAAGYPVWFEMCSKNFEASEAFYREVFGTELETVFTDPMRYQTMSIDNWQFGGHMDAAVTMPAPVPSHWQVYFGVDDVDAACERVGERKGQVLQPPFDTPYGRMALVADPFGATFMIMKGNLDSE